ncbi:AAA family ATPase, partial [Thermodesulfobacteriota bacterium]
AGRGQAFSIMGEAGVGKSRLLYEYRKAVSSEEVTFLEGKCLSFSRRVAFNPIIDLLRAYFSINEEDADFSAREKVERGVRELGVDEEATVPYLLDLLGVKDSGVPSSMTPDAKRKSIIESLNI